MKSSNEKTDKMVIVENLLEQDLDLYWNPEYAKELYEMGHGECVERL